MSLVGYRRATQAYRNLGRVRQMVFAHTDARQAPAEWLQDLLRGPSEPPKLYAWTPANLPGATARSSPATVDRAVVKHSDEQEKRRIYVLGIGNLGRLFATSLAKLATRPPITLVVHRKELLERWVSDPGIEMTKLGKTEKLTEFDIEWWTDEKPPSDPVREPAFGDRIANLIIATKAPDSMPQVDRLRRYLDDTSSVAFVQNGICKLWPPAGGAYTNARFPQSLGPHWMICVTTHGVTSLGPFRSIHTSPANVFVGSVRASDKGSDYLAKQIIDAPGLASKPVSTRDLWIAQLEKLVVNSTLNPLTAILRCKNGELVTKRDDSVADILDRSIDEAGEVLRALVLDPSVEVILREENGESLDATRAQLLQRFSGPRLRDMFYTLAPKFMDNRSSMLQDVEAGKQTEIREFNGWLVETAEYLNLASTLPTHRKLIALVEDNAILKRNELHDHFPQPHPV